ncbi:hypothetical protein [Marinibactrum halimedae]|uniref:Uncharacterized protein n=1 Tax=Marinibactrum halimedae TaxID=1444977 RepID=A0AA37T670_9GAMM|nr:hypothetical protein [Marinibactrum halimedae]MCD9458048.1 hypothetical protein [Marinibactrum halimedae]GLS27675.1 hypothetical protein GCM10007877_33940 [Marinibactrum halimedae]
MPVGGAIPSGGQSGSSAPNNPGPNGRDSNQSGGGSESDSQESSQWPSDNNSGDNASNEPPSLDEESNPSDDIDFSEETSSSSSANASSEASSAGGGSADDSRTEGGAGGGSPGNEPVMTDRERVAQMESVLEGSIASYDGMILREREYIQNRRNENGSEEDLDDPVTGPLYEEDSSGEGGGGGGMGGVNDAYESSSAGNGTRPEGPGDNRQGEYNHQGGQSAPPADIPDGSDDDVVARQIREAAMKETDPVLREKLWEEYRKYKNQSQ